MAIAHVELSIGLFAMRFAAMQTAYGEDVVPIEGLQTAIVLPETDYVSGYMMYDFHAFGFAGLLMG